MPSISGRIVLAWEMSRDKIKEFPTFLRRGRELRTAFTNLIGYIRFQTEDQGNLSEALRPRCRTHMDNWAHSKRRYDLDVHEKPGVDKKASWTRLKKILRRKLRRIRRRNTRPHPPFMENSMNKQIEKKNWIDGPNAEAT